MQECEKCHTEFKWIDIYKSVLKSTKIKITVYCRQCETEHVINLESRIISVFFMSLTAVISLSVVWYNFDTFGLLSFSLFILVYLVLLTFVFTITPFIFKFHSIYHSNYKV
ncbi:TIGR04104 family putative zinc finger protein [Saliterribacillus persicus]|uniref:CXXC-20-CXXC protein n=1 Tax=Saliterribacillus persicus TaxID=930114 RepID=A0A368X6M4_9BACI|nr:CXXC-20-CXXC protein [Saliterribacillus persicus]